MHILVAGICVVLLSFRPALLHSPRDPGELSFHPLKVSGSEGSSVSFYCNYSHVNFSQSDYSLNLYKVETNSNQSQKIAELTEFTGNTSQSRRKNIQLIKHDSTVEMRIQNLHKNDTGTYYCGLIAFSSSSKVMESKKSQLTVTAPEATSSPIHPTVTVWDEGTGDFHVLLIVVLSVAGAVLLGLVAYMLFIIMRRPAGQQKPQSENAPSEGKPLDVTVYTVDYGVLEFQQEAKTKALEESFPPDQTEYATIVFLEEKPVTPERGKKTKTQMTYQTQTQPC